MNPFARIVVGYHGCSKQFADRLLGSDASLLDWDLSSNAYDWLGQGIYFWEHSPARAMRWAEEKARQDGSEPAVIGAVLQLGRCFDLTDEANTRNLRLAHELIHDTYSALGKPLPRNVGMDADRKGRYLDCLVINYYLQEVASLDYQTVRCAFTEGGPAYDGSMLMVETHIQIAVIDRSCILGVFRPTLGV